ncbi:MAG: eukaryotic-like serine/threonine-protein kinase [Acidobacteriaceae bacterium]|nr:eukaryotic-like serine/threonine-protein kinase [Acidobacteriaceae bacterium]
MKQELWRRVEELFHAALERMPETRQTFLDGMCGADSALRRQVELLLAAEEQAGSFLEVPAIEDIVHSLTAAESMLGQQFGPYQIVSPLGAGGMGEVFRALDTRLGRDVAIKISQERFSARFEREARAISSLNHQHICTLYDVGPNYLVMELVEGETLRDWLKRVQAVEPCLEIARQVLEALRAAHRAGVIHRDLKPENIMVRFDNYVKVLDFGLAKMTPASPLLGIQATAKPLSQPGQIVGTVAYMSPEQILGQGTDQRSDLFSFGIILYEMLTRQHPWPCSSSVDRLHAILHDEPHDTSLMSAELASIVHRLLRKSPAERYPLAETVLEAIASRGSSSGFIATDTNSKPLTSIAVLPFVFLSDVEGSKAFSLGFADALITMLGSLEDITVVPTSAILNYAAGSDPAHTCRDLGVRYVLQGNVQKLGAHWRVSIQLFDSVTQKTAFSEKRDFNMENVFEVQDEIGRWAVECLQGRFSRAVPKSRDRYSSEPEAFDEFVTGLRESYSDRPETLLSAVEHLSIAVERDPEFALAHATLSLVCMQMCSEFDPQHAWLERAEHHCSVALTLDPALPEGHSARAFILWSPAKNFQHADAIASLERVLAAQPNNERAHNRMAAICLHIGRLQEARIAHEQAQRSNPKTGSNNLEFFYLYSGNFASAEKAAEAWIRDQRRETRYALWYYPLPPLMTGDLDLAEHRLAEGLKQLPDGPLIISLQGLLHARRGQPDLALQCVRRSLDSASRSFGHNHHTYYQIACVHAILRERHKAMEWLERSVDTGFACWPFFRIDPHLESLREEPEFKRLVADLEHKYTAQKIRRL